MVPFVSDFFLPWCEVLTMAARREKRDVLFAVNVLSDNLLDKPDHHAYSELIVDYFGDSGDETE